MLMATETFGGDVKVHTRKSMLKFSMEETKTSLDLEVVRLATYMPGYLNKQVILVLWANGIHQKIFQKMQFKFVEKLLSFFKLKYLNGEFEYPNEIFQSFRIIGKKLYEMHAKHINYSNDPFIKPMIKAICFNKFKEVRKRFRIYDEYS